MRTDERKTLIDRYTGWAEAWGLSLAFAITQSLEKSERIMGEAIASLVATAKALDPKDIHAAVAPRFASVVWEISNTQAYRGFGTETFFKMPAVTRAVVMLKTKAKFSRAQIAQALALKPTQVDDHLENARLLYSSGQSWLGGSDWISNCELASRVTKSAGLQGVFAHYIGNDLDSDSTRRLHVHLADCSSCRKSFSHFKQQYVDWMNSVPALEADLKTRKQWKQVTNLALRLNEPRSPSPWPGLKTMAREAQMRALLFGALSLLILHFILSRGR